MSELIYIFDNPYRSSDGRDFQVHVQGVRSGHVWHGWLVFVPFNGEPELETDRETTQSNRDALEYWATGLEPLYLDGAFERASRPHGRPRDREPALVDEVIVITSSS